MGDQNSDQKKTSLGLATKALHKGRAWSEKRENSPAIFANSSYVFETAEQGQRIFAGDEEGNIYSRFTNPTVEAFEIRIAALEDGEAALGTATGMAAITTMFLAHLNAGDHLVISRSVFGSTTNVTLSLLQRLGIEVTQVTLSDLDAWQAAIKKNTRMFFSETPANPTLEMVDIRALANIAHNHDILLVVDNVFSTPILQRPLQMGADIVVQSATKYIDGQGRMLGGAIIGKEAYLTEYVLPMLRNTGPTLSPFNAWVLLKALETLPLRMERHCSNTEKVVQFLTERPSTKDLVHYPGLTDHPQHALAKKQMDHFGALFCLLLKDQQQAHALLNALQLATITANLGDSKTLVTHPATTTHSRISAEQREAAGVYDGLVRFSIGLEDWRDIVADLEQALEKVGL
ncbi:O-succinylhomoserine sulfhydrylase [Magnetococcales bacterium HHB-1]